MKVACKIAPYINKDKRFLAMSYYTLRGRRIRDRIVVGFSTTSAISAYRH